MLADVDHVIHPLLRARFSGRAMDGQGLSPTDLRSILEAGRWAPSAFNAQPWRFLTAPREHEADFAALLSCLVPGNQSWAGRAGALVLACAETAGHKGRINTYAQHDLGLSVAMIMVEAQHRGLCVHAMAGFDAAAARKALKLPDSVEPVAMLAIGRLRDALVLVPALAERELAPRERRPQSELVFAGRYGQPLRLAHEAAVARITDHWLGPLDEDGCASSDKERTWFAKDAAFDDALRDLFIDDYHAIVDGQREDWRGSAWGLLSYVIVLDQFSRNFFRGKAGMYRADAQCLAAVEQGLGHGLDRALPGAARTFLYMPLMHAEDVRVQDQCVQCFGDLCDATPPGPLKSRLERNVDYARRHRDIVARFDRFPHRNAILGRVSTPEELAFLQEDGSSF